MMRDKASSFKMTGQPTHYLTLTKMLIGVIVVSQVVITTSALPSISLSSGTSNIPEPEAWKSSSEEIYDDDDYIGFVQKLIFGIIAFVIVVLALCLILCFCCPICIIAKMRQRRGVVIRTTGSGATTTTNGNTVTVTVNRSAAPQTTNATSPQVVAISNNFNARNKPYPVQESVTVVPLLQPISSQYPPNSQPMNIGYHPNSQPMNFGYPPQGPQFQQNFELPPPYPGLQRDSDTDNLPYNPYFAGGHDSPSAPPPK